MDPLTQLLMQRQLSQQAPPSQTQPQPTPVVPPSGGNSHVPTEVQRFENAQQIQNAYRSGGAINPVLLQAKLGHQ